MFVRCLVLAVALGAPLARGQVSDSAFESQHPLAIEEGQLTGSGSALFLEDCYQAHYVLFGEQHGVGGVAEFVTAAQRDLQDQGYHYFIRESGEWFANQLCKQSPEQFLREYPYSLAFDFNAEVALLQQTFDLFGPGPRRFIGVDQEITLVHPLQFISRHGPTVKSRRVARGLYLKAALLFGRYVKQDFSADLLHLRDAVEADPEFVQLVDSMRKSMDIYVQHISGDRQKSVEDREQLMKDLFDRARADLDGDARFLAKMGGMHIMKGIVPGQQFKSLGGHIQEFASRQGQETLHIGIRSWDAGNVLPVSDELQTADFVYVRSAPFRQELQARGALTADIASQLNQFDAFILIPDAGAVSNSTVRSWERQFVNRLIRALALIVPCLVLLSMPAIYGVVGFIRGRKGRPAESPGRSHRDVLVFAACLLTLVVIQLLLLVRAPHYASPSSTWFVWITDAIMVVGICVLVRNALKRHGQSLSQGYFVRQYAGILGCAGISMFVMYWNLNGMLGI